VRQRVVPAALAADAPAPTGVRRGPLHRFVLAQDEARRLGHNYVGTEHLLLGLHHDQPTRTQPTGVLGHPATLGPVWTWRQARMPGGCGRAYQGQVLITDPSIVDSLDDA
jgi:hypothetical protein